MKIICKVMAKVPTMDMPDLTDVKVQCTFDPPSKTAVAHLHVFGLSKEESEQFNVGDEAILNWGK